MHIETAHTAMCNALSTIDRRLACWLLMAHDRIGDETLLLTHDFLSIMLAVRLPRLTEACIALRTQGLISHQRGQKMLRNLL
jgi:hypothetical protein